MMMFLFRESYINRAHLLMMQHIKCAGNLCALTKSEALSFQIRSHLSKERKGKVLASFK